MMNSREDFTATIREIASPAEDDEAPPREYVSVERRVTLSNGRSVGVRIMRPVDAAPWSDEDEIALRALLDVAAEAFPEEEHERPTGPRLMS